MSETLVGASQTWSGTTFMLGKPGAVDAVSGGTIPLPKGTFSTLKLLAASVNGSQVSQPFVVAYADGTTSTFTQSVSNWWASRSYPGESPAVTMSYVLTPNRSKLSCRSGVCGLKYYLYGYAFNLNSAKPIKSITLPNNRVVVLGDYG